MAKYRLGWTCIVFSRGHRSKFIWPCLFFIRLLGIKVWFLSGNFGLENYGWDVKTHSLSTHLICQKEQPKHEYWCSKNQDMKTRKSDFVTTIFNWNKIENEQYNNAFKTWKFLLSMIERSSKDSKIKMNITKIQSQNHF